MGNRRKLLYKGGLLLDALTGETIRRWKVAHQHIHPSECRVELQALGAEDVTIAEDQEGIWVEEDGNKALLSAGPVKLPRFEGHPHASLLRVLHQELLVNIIPAGPVPNFLVYPKPWYRDGAMVCMCLKKTGNLHLVEGWIQGLREPFDRNNAGNCEPDNLGEALYMISLVSDAKHPAVQTILDAVRRFRKDNHIVGITDGAEHPVYQTKWLKYGLRALGLDDPHEIPRVYDSYSALFWMDFRPEHVEGAHFSEKGRDLYPYLGWAEDHFYNRTSKITWTDGQYPVTWEASASKARYQGMEMISSEFVDRRIAAPHTWHAAEMFLYLL